MANFKTTRLTTLPAIIEPLSDSAKFWKNNVQPAIVSKELSAVNCIDINAANEILTTSSARISLYEASNLEVKKTFSSPNHTLLYSGTFRQANSKIFSSGANDGIVRVWDVKKSNPLRLLGTSEKSKKDKHSAAVHRVNFNGINQLFSFGDDKAIKLWDITEDSVLCSIGEGKAHKDYIRASCLLGNMSSIVSGSYDHTVKVWDHRTPQNCTFQYNHGSPVESVTYRDFLLISAGETTIKIFDMVAGKVLRNIENAHHKTITCVYNHGDYLLTASIDGHVKVYDINLNVATTLSYVPSQLLSCSYNGSLLAVGSSDGILSVNKVIGKDTFPRVALPTSSINADDDESDQFFFDSIPIEKKQKLNVGDAFVVKSDRKRKYLQKHEELLRKFQHSRAMTRVMRMFSKDDPQAVVSFMQELIRRGGLRTALAGRTDLELKRIVHFLTQNLSDPRFTRILVDVSLALVEVYTRQINRSPAIQTVFKHLNQSLNREIDALSKMSQISGQLQLLINWQIK